MDELGFDAKEISSWFPSEQEDPYVLVRVPEEHSAGWTDGLVLQVRRSYITDAALDESARARKVSASVILSAKLPDAGSTMAGDFGEILTYLYHSGRTHPAEVIGAKKWRLKHDRTKPAPHSDVVQFVLPDWPTATSDDTIICSEVKTKSTKGTFKPIPAAIEGAVKDRTSRLTRTLVWLRERGLTEDLGDVRLEHLERFINAAEFPAAQKQFHAVAVVCSALVEAERLTAPDARNNDYQVLVIAVPKLYEIYNAIYEAVIHSGDTD